MSGRLLLTTVFVPIISHYSFHQQQKKQFVNNKHSYYRVTNVHAMHCWFDLKPSQHLIGSTLCNNYPPFVSNNYSFQSVHISNLFVNPPVKQNAFVKNTILMLSLYYCINNCNIASNSGDTRIIYLL